jgi:integral membrane protein (TIGR01906 family)
VTRTLPERIAAIATGLAAAIVVVAIAILPFLTPAWVAFEQGRTNAAGLTGYAEPDLRTATNAILHDLVIGPPDFAVEVGGRPVLEERERSHMRDVRGVFAGFGLLAIVSAVVAVAGVLGARRMGHVERAWRAIGTGMGVLIVAIVVAGVVATFAFEAAFELFHRLFFPGGSYTFDPRTDRLVQLFPFDFWSETTIALGGVIVVLAVAVAFVAGRLARRASAAAAAREHGRTAAPNVGEVAGEPAAAPR